MIENKLFIEMVEYTNNYKPQQTGKYLVRTVSSFLNTVNIFSTMVYENGKVDISNQKVTHISKLPL